MPSVHTSAVVSRTVAGSVLTLEHESHLSMGSEHTTVGHVQISILDAEKWA